MKKIVSPKEEERVLDALNYMGKSYVKVPRFAFDQLHSAKRSEYRFGLLYLFIFGFSFHSDGYVKRNGQRMLCRCGELITSLNELSIVTHFSRSSVHHLLQKMMEANLLVFDRIPGGFVIRLIGYEQFTNVETNKSADHKVAPSSSPFDSMQSAEDKLGRSMQQNEKTEPDE